MPELDTSKPIDFQASATANILGLEGVNLNAWKKFQAMARPIKTMEEDNDEIVEDKRNPNEMAEENQVTIYGPIISDESADMYRMFDIRSFVTPDMVKKQLKECEGDIELMINSPGGSVFAMAEIMNSLDNYEGGKITAKITGMAVSAATMVMLCSDEIQIAEMAEMMIHRPRGGLYGKSDELLSAGNALKDKEEMVAAKYAAKSGKTPKKMMELMDKETWMVSTKAIEMGLADKLMEKKRDKKDDAEMSAEDLVVNTAEVNEEQVLSSIQTAREMLMQQQM